ncbi:MAG TPA: galactose-1-phosphate uridylyltransferase [Chitinophagales bacterium]|nr:galactose-1-phosphate uridylyltransferase [Chitinophagales bacterium]HRK27382.1 galactose-1-phosphate uridylyltransferase [Chitinophagales bacterium]
MPHLRYNPLLRTYTMVAANRQSRPHLPADYCPFCPGSGKVPNEYDVYVYANDFPALSNLPDAIEEGQVEQLSGYATHQAPAYGCCEVILYASNHRANLYDLPLWHIEKLVATWQQRHRQLSANERIQYIFPFENRGEEVGVTMHHPHGQLYAYPFVPLKIVTELDSCHHYYRHHGEPLFEALNRFELSDGRRIITQNDHFVAYLPYFTDYPYGVFIVAKHQLANFDQFTPAHITALAQILRQITGAFDHVFDRPFPYMMCIHQTPVNSPQYADAHTWYRFHIEFYPPLREKNKVKWYASSEMGAWAAANTLAVEDTAQTLRQALAKWENQV